MKNLQFSKTVWVFFYIFIFCMLLWNSFSCLDNDFGWHLKVGEEIIENHEIPRTEHFNYPLAGKKWVDHEWLIDAFSYFIFDSFGYLFLSFFFAALIIFVLVLQKHFLQKYFLENIKADFWIMFFQFFGIKASLPHMGVRMQEITVLLLFLLLFILYKFSIGKNYKILFFLIPLLIFWVNVHGGFLIALALLGFFVFIKTLENLIDKYGLVPGIKVSFKNRLEYRSIFIFSVFSFFAFLATFINPYGWKLYEFLFGYKNSYYLTNIAEWVPFYFFPLPYYQILYTAIVLSFVMVFLYMSLRKQSGEKKKYFIKIDLWQLAITLLFVFLALKSRRHFPLLFIVSMPMLVMFYIQQIASYFKDEIKDTQLVKFSKIVLILIFILASFKMLLNTKFNNYPFDSKYYCDRNYPCAALDFIRENDLTQKKLFNDYDWGGFMIWTMPEMKLFIDGRLPQFEINGHTYLEEYHEFFIKDKVKDKLDQYGIDLVLLKERDLIKFNWLEKKIFMIEEDNINMKENFLKDFLDNNSNWKLIYSDKFSYVYEKLDK